MDTTLQSDSYDSDLGWILEKLTDRAGASAGLIVRFGDAGESRCVLATHDRQASLSPQALEVLCDVVAQAQPWRGLQALPADLGSIGGPRVRMLALRFTPAPGVVVVAAICRPEISFNLLQNYVAARLEPVLERYIHLWWLHRSERRRANILERAIDQCDLGVIVLDQHLRLLYGNPAATLLLRAADGLRLCGGAITATEEAQSHKLTQALQRACERRQRSKGDARTATSTLLTLPRRHKRALIISVVGVDAPVLEPADAAVLLYVLDPEHDVSMLLAPAFRIYRLTATESKLVARLVSGADLTDAAAGMNLAVQTARSYLKQIFLKTGTNRQAELVRVMCGSAARATLVGEFSSV